MLGDGGSGGVITGQFVEAAGGGDGESIDALIELNLDHPEGRYGAETRLKEVLVRAKLHYISQHFRVIGDRYVPCRLSMTQAENLVVTDMISVIDAGASTAGDRPAPRAISQIWPDSEVHPLANRTADVTRAVRASYVAVTRLHRQLKMAGFGHEPLGEGIVWAVIDSGIDKTHPHFHRYNTLEGNTFGFHQSYIDVPGAPLDDPKGHGTHVAGVIAGESPAHGAMNRYLGERIRPSKIDPDDIRMRGEPPAPEYREMDAGECPIGVAPAASLVSLRVFDGLGNSRVSSVIEALEYVRKNLAQDGSSPRVHGVNLSLGYAFNPRWSACGCSPLCREVDAVVQAGVVVVAAAGNIGYGTLLSQRHGNIQTGLTVTIYDPGNAENAITVGATDERNPLEHGVTWFSSKGPTADGRWKPDLVAPGERVISCATGKARNHMPPGWAGAEIALYVEESGTSMAAPYVSGAIATFLSIYPEFIGRPWEVKQIFLETAQPLGRDRYFEGHGLIDLISAIRSV